MTPLQAEQTKDHQLVFETQNVILKINELSVSLNNNRQPKPILHQINFELEKNTVTAIIGHSGCGKSTLLKCFNMLLDKNLKATGSIFFQGLNILNHEWSLSELRAKIGMVFQRPTCFDMSILDNIAFGLKIHGLKDKVKREQIAKQALEEVGLWNEVKDNLNQNALELSGGQQQRLCIARAISLFPEVLLMDEPTSALDPFATRTIEDLIVRLKKTYTIIIVTHSLKQTARISDYTIYMHQGQIVEYNKTKRLFLKPQSKVTENYINIENDDNR